MTRNAGLPDSEPPISVIAELNNLLAYRPSGDQPPWEAWVQRWTILLLVSAGGMFLLLLALAGMFVLMPLPSWATAVALGLGVAIQLTALLALVLLVASGLVSIRTQFRRQGQQCEAEAAHDHRMARRLAQFPAASLLAADAWIEQKVRRLERRQLRFMGSPDKLGVVALLAAAWSVWSGNTQALTTWQPSPLLFGSAFVAGLAIGSVATSKVIDRLLYQRDVLRLAMGSVALRAVAQTGPSLEAPSSDCAARRTDTAPGPCRGQLPS